LSEIVSKWSWHCLWLYQNGCDLVCDYNRMVV